LIFLALVGADGLEIGLGGRAGQVYGVGGAVALGEAGNRPFGSIRPV
jgi:hypothetical protein